MNEILNPNYLYLPSTIDTSLLDDRMAFLVHYLYIFPFKYKERVKKQVFAQKKWNKNPPNPIHGLDFPIPMGGCPMESISVSSLTHAGSSFSYVSTSGSGSVGDGTSSSFSYVSTLGSKGLEDGASSSSSYISTLNRVGSSFSYVFTSDDYLLFWDGFVPIHSKELIKYFTWKDYSRVRDDLIKSNIIQVDWSYKNTSSDPKLNYPMRYSLPPIHRFSPPSVYMMTDSRFIKKLNIINTLRRGSLSPLLEKLEDKLYEIDFDEKGAKNKVKSTTYKCYDSYLSRLKGIQIMKDKNPFHYHLYEGNNCKRVFSPITSLSRDIRPFITYHGQNLWDIDVSCTLPTLFNYYLDGKSKDINLYRELTSTNEHDYGLYEYLGELWDVENRDMVKILTMVLFFGKESTIKSYRNKFRNEFPLVYETIKNHKRNSNSLANDLMRLEREIMIDTVVDGLVREDEKTMLLTIHDGIVTTEDNVDETKTRIKQTIKDKVGIVPNVKVKLLK